MVGLLDYESAAKLLGRYKISHPESRYVSSPKDAMAFSNGKPIALKAITEKAMHKAQNGLVELNLSGEQAIDKAFAVLLKKAAGFKPYKILAQRMVAGSKEIIIGGNTDSQFGKMILLGLGGTYVNAFHDFSLRVCPITKEDALLMLSELKTGKILAPDKESEGVIVDLLLKASRLFYEGKFSEMDLNPVILHDGTYDAVDIRILG